MSPPAIEIESPVETRFSAFFSEKSIPHDQQNMDPSFSSFSTENGTHFGFGAGSGEKTKSRPKTRLVKLRKNGRKVKGTSFSGEVIMGFNPFTPPPSKVSVGSVHINTVNDGESPEDKAFVFGANGNSASAPGTPSTDDEQFSTPIGEFFFASELAKEHSDDVLRKGDSDNLESVRACNESTACDSGESESCSDACRKPDGVQKADGKTIDGSEVDLLAEMEKLNISDSRVHGGNSYGEARESNNASAFIFGSSRKADVEYKGVASDSAADKRPTFHSGATNLNNLASTIFGTKTPFDYFKVPVCDPSLLKNSLFPEMSTNPVHVRRKHSSKDQRSKKIKDEPNRFNDQASQGTESKEKLSSPGYCSPMEFSPYEGEKASNQFETPLTSIDPSHSREHVNFCDTNEFKVATATDPSVSTEEDHGSNHMPEFSFSASTSQGEATNKNLQAVKKYRRKVRVPKKCLQATMRNNQENQPVNTGQAKQESSSTSLTPDECEVWRLRGNHAYKNGDICKAEEYYTHGIKSSSSSDVSEYSVKPLALCYGNRAAARISLGRLREAISDCEIAALLDPTYIKAYMRAANCHLVLGELGSAVQYFNKCIASASSVCLDRKTTIESAEGLQQAQRVADYTNSASMFMEKRTPNDASEALVPIVNALSISSCSEKLLQMKAEALFKIRHYKEVIELCENTLQTAQKNFVTAGLVGLKNVDGLRSKHHSVIVWRWNMTSKSHFYLGNLEKALDILEKLQQVGSDRNENQEECRDSPASLVATISELLRYKNAGNEAVRAGKYIEAVEQYTAALSKNVDSRPFAAICFCNRAAANQALVQIADAIADCSLAMALDENYTKAVSRRATLHEMIRDYSHAATDLQRLISILVKQNSEKTTSADRASSRKELKQARQRLSVMEEKSKEGIALDLFLIMGVKASDTAADIKKTYRRAALKHHPDKAAQILVRSESEGPWLNEILEEVHKGADRLFKTIGEAYSVLSDPTKRSDYELEEQIRKARAARESYRSREYAEASTSPFQTSASRRYWNDNGRRYRNTPTWW